MVNRARTDYAAMALAAGFPHARTIDTREELTGSIQSIAGMPGPSLTVLRVEPESTFLGTPPMTYEGPEMKYRFGRAMEQKLGITVFGPQGY